jgi:hypothetical protein
MPAPPLPGRTEWQGVRDAVELFILERRADKKQPSTIPPAARPVLRVADAPGRGRRRP